MSSHSGIKPPGYTARRTDDTAIDERQLHARRKDRARGTVVAPDYPYDDDIQSAVEPDPVKSQLRRT